MYLSVDRQVQEPFIISPPFTTRHPPRVPNLHHRRLTVGWILYKVLMSQGKAGQIKLALIVVGLIFLALAVTGRAPALFAILGAAMTQVMRFAPLLVRFMPSLKKAYTNSTDPGAANRSQVVTKLLKMTLDHASGTMDGEVLEGTLSGRQLQTLSLDELKMLYQYCNQQDAEAARLLMSFIACERADSWDGDTSYGSGGGQAGGSQVGTGASAMDKHEAMSILGLEEPFTKKEITQGGRDRNAGYPAPLAQIPACATNAPGSCLEFWRQSELPDTDG